MAASTSFSSAALDVLLRVHGNGKYDDQALDDILDVGVDVHIDKTVADDLENQNAGNDTADFTDAAAHGDTADHTGCDCVKLIALAEIVGGAAGAACVEEACKGVGKTGDDIDQKRDNADVDAGNDGSFTVAADGEHIAPETRAVPQHPEQNGDDDCIENNIGNSEAPCATLV